MTISIITDASAMTALQNLSATQTALNTTQSQISSGLKVATASDNAAYWSISSTLKSDIGALSAVSYALNLGSSVVSTAAAAVTSTLTLLNKIKADLVTAQQPGTSLASVQTDITAQQQSLMSILSSASFNGVNLLDGSAGTSSLTGVEIQAASASTSGVAAQASSQSLAVIHPIGHPIVGPIAVLTAGDTMLIFVTSIMRQTSGGISTTALGTTTLDTTTTNLIGSGGVLNGSPGNSGSTNILTMSLTATGASLATMEADTEAAITSVTAVGALIGGVGTVLANQQSYVISISDAITSGMGSLVDADMNVASTRLRALQTQQELGLQALAIANGNSGLILKLFTTSH